MRADYSFLRPSKPIPHVRPLLKVGIVATPAFTLMSLACFVEFLRLSSDEMDYSRRIYCSWDLLSHDEKPIVASCGFPLIPMEKFGDPRDYDYIVVHGGILHGQSPVPDELYEFVQSSSAAGIPLVGLCTGQFVLAELGLLNEKRCAVHFSLVSAMTQLFPAVKPVTNVPVVVDGSIITCPGGLASINLAMQLVTLNCGRSRGQKALRYLMAGHGFEAVQSLKDDAEMGLHCLDQRVVNAIALMREKMFETRSISELATTVGTTERELARLFQKYLRVSPAEHWRSIRLKEAHWMIVNSSRSIAQIAHECGFTDSSHMIHWFKRTYRATPSQLRKLHADFGLH